MCSKSITIISLRLAFSQPKKKTQCIAQECFFVLFFYLFIYFFRFSHEDGEIMVKGLSEEVCLSQAEADTVITEHLHVMNIHV